MKNYLSRSGMLAFIAEYSGEELPEEQTRTLALFPRNALDNDKWLAGDRSL